MSIEQTNQLILLILNSVLMALLAAGLLGGAWLRQQSLMQQLRQVKARYRRMTCPKEGSISIAIHDRSAMPSAASQSVGHSASSHSPAATLKSDLKLVRDRRQQLSRQYHWSYVGMLSLHVALLVFSVSLFALALRSLLPFNGLIPLALGLYVIGAASLLIGASCVLADLLQGNGQGQSLRQVIGQIVAQLTQTSRRWRSPRSGLWSGRASLTSASPGAGSPAPTPVAATRPVSKAG